MRAVAAVAGGGVWWWRCRRPAPVALATLAFYVAYRLAEDYLIVPRIMGRTVQVPAIVSLIAVLIGGVLLGIIGARGDPGRRGHPAAAARDRHPPARQELSQVSGDAYLVHGLAPRLLARIRRFSARRSATSSPLPAPAGRCADRTDPEAWLRPRPAV